MAIDFSKDQKPDENNPQSSPLEPRAGLNLSVKSKRNWPRIFAITSVIVLVVLAAVLVWQKYYSDTPKTAAIVKNDIPIIKYGVIEGPLNSFHPNHGSDGLNVAEVELNSQIFEGLVRYEDQTKIVPALADSWTNPDASTWVFNLKQGVKFHSGRTMTAADVKASLENYRDTDIGQLFGNTVKAVEVVNDNQVLITTVDPDPILLNKLVFLYIIDSAAAKPDDPANGTGPYVVKPGTETTENSIDLVAFDGYHGGHVYTRELQVRVEDPAVLPAKLKDGTYNIIYVNSGQDVSDLRGAGFEPIRAKGLYIYHLGFNFSRAVSPLLDKRLREAVYLATDPVGLMQARGVQGDPASQIVSDEIPGFNPGIKRPARDVERAKELLTEAGHPDGITLTITHGAQSQVAIDALIKQLAEANITLVSDAIVESQTLGERVFGGDTQMYFLSYATDLLDASDVFANNFQGPNYQNDELDRLLAEANIIFDPAKRLDVLQRISKIIMDDIAWAPLYRSAENYMMDKPYVLKKDLPNTDLGTYFWQAYAQ